jgi:penicillin amidase
MTGGPTAVLRARGSTLEDLAFAQGRGTVEVSRDRLLEDLAHVRAATGTPWDAFATRSLLARTARRAHARLGDGARGLVDAYAAGVRAGGLDAWEDWTSLGVMAVHHSLFGSLGHHLWRRHVRRTLGAGALERLVQEAPALSGSNAWVVGGARSADGSPLIGADPHRIVTVPGVYQRVHLVATADDVDVVGLTFPGVPGVQHFGHTGTVAWAITNAMADTQQLTDVGPDAPRDLVDGVPVTAHGPLVLQHPDGSGVAVRTVPWELDDLGLDALPRLLRARTVADVDTALEAWVEPVNDVLVADVEGRVLHRVAGRVPRREPDGTWSGWVSSYRREVGPDGHAVVANHRQGEHSADLADELAPPHRGRRLEQLLAERDVLDVETGAALHADTLLLPAAAWQGRLRSLVLDGEPSSVVGLRDRLVAWDRRMDADSVEAALFATLRSVAVRGLLAHPAVAPLARTSSDPWTGPGELFAPWLRPEPRLALALDRWVDGDPPLDGVDVDALLADGLREAAPVPSAARGPAPPPVPSAPTTWGDVHTFMPPGGPTVRLAGDDGCVLSTSSLPGLDDRVWRGPVARLVWCLADRSRSRWTVPDELDVWASGATSPLEA